MKNAVQFLSEVKSELLRIEWPTFHEFVGSTIIVLIMVCFFALYIGIIDRIIFALIEKIFAYSAG